MPGRLKKLPMIIVQVRNGRRIPTQISSPRAFPLKHCTTEATLHVHTSCKLIREVIFTFQWQWPHSLIPLFSMVLIMESNRQLFQMSLREKNSNMIYKTCFVIYFLNEIFTLLSFIHFTFSSCWSGVPLKKRDMMARN